VIAAKFGEAWRGLIVAVVACITTSLCLSLGVYFSYVPHLVDYVANSDVESLFSPALLSCR